MTHHPASRYDQDERALAAAERAEPWGWLAVLAVGLASVLLGQVLVWLGYGGR